MIGSRLTWFSSETDIDEPIYQACCFSCGSPDSWLYEFPRADLLSIVLCDACHHNSSCSVVADDSVPLGGWMVFRLPDGFEMFLGYVPVVLGVQCMIDYARSCSDIRGDNSWKNRLQNKLLKVGERNFWDTSEKWDSFRTLVTLWVSSDNFPLFRLAPRT